MTIVLELFLCIGVIPLKLDVPLRRCIYDPWSIQFDICVETAKIKNRIVFLLDLGYMATVCDHLFPI